MGLTRRPRTGRTRAGSAGSGLGRLSSRGMALRGAAGFALGAALFVGAAMGTVETALATPTESASASGVSGSATLRSGRATSKVGATTKIAEGDLLTVADGGRVTVGKTNQWRIVNVHRVVARAVVFGHAVSRSEGDPAVQTGSSVRFEISFALG